MHCAGLLNEKWKEELLQKVGGYLDGNQLVLRQSDDDDVTDLVVEVDHVILDGDVALHVLQPGVTIVVIII